MSYLVESPIWDRNGERVGTFKVRVATEERAIEIAAGAPDRFYRRVDDEPQLPETD
jgi:hypothetical protein